MVSWGVNQWYWYSRRNGFCGVCMCVCVTQTIMTIGVNCGMAVMSLARNRFVVKCLAVQKRQCIIIYAHCIGHIFNYQYLNRYNQSVSMFGWIWQCITCKGTLVFLLSCNGPSNQMYLSLCLSIIWQFFKYVCVIFVFCILTTYRCVMYFQYSCGWGVSGPFKGLSYSVVLWLVQMVGIVFVFLPYWSNILCCNIGNAVPDFFIALFFLWGFES